MQQQAVTLSLRLQLFGREPGLSAAAALVGRLDLRFDRFAFPAPCHASLYVARCGWRISAALDSTRRGRFVGYDSIAAKRKGRTLLAFIAFEAADLLPAMRARHDASAQSQRITRGLIRRRQVMFHAFGYQLHICHQPNLTGPSNRDLDKPAANTEARAGFAERAPPGAIGNAAQQRSKLPDPRVEVCTLLCRVLIQVGFQLV
jgi:hypothetical protein